MAESAVVKASQHDVASPALVERAVVEEGRDTKDRVPKNTLSPVWGVIGKPGRLGDCRTPIGPRTDRSGRANSEPQPPTPGAEPSHPPHGRETHTHPSRLGRTPTPPQLW